jgi:hypothetical protein
MRRTRRDTRYLIPRPWDGTLSVQREVLVERHDEALRELWVLSALPVHVEEVLTLDLPESTRKYTVKVVESRPVMIDGTVHHRLRLGIVDAPGAGNRGPGAE